MARAIWKGRLATGGDGIAVKLYTAVEDRALHFHLLHRDDLEPVSQRIVGKADGREVAPEDRRKALPLDADDAVIVQPDELEALEPEPSREIHLCRFVPPSVFDEQWYDRPYLVGPDGDDDGYFAFAEALERSGRVGVVRWVMRKQRYLGMLGGAAPGLWIVTLRRAEQVLAVGGVEPTRSQQPAERELGLAGQLLEAIAGDFEPGEWHDAHRERVLALIEAKAAGRRPKAAPAPRRRSGGDLADALRRSVAAAKEQPRG